MSVLARALARLSPSDRRALRLGGIALAVLVAVWAVVLPLGRAVLADRDRLASERALLRREEAAVRDLPAELARSRRDDAALARAGSRLLPGGDPLAAAAALAAYVREQAESSELQLRRADAAVLEVDAAAPREAWTAVGVDIRADGDAGAVVGFLMALERGPRLVRVERLGIERQAGPDGERGVLALTATVRGFWAPARLAGGAP